MLPSGVGLMRSEGVDSHGELLTEGDGGATGNLQVVDVASVNGAHDPIGVSCRRRVRFDHVIGAFRTGLHIAIDELDGGRKSGDDLAIALYGDLDREDLALERQVGRGPVDRRTVPL